MQADTRDNKEINYTNRIFDIILNLNMLKTMDRGATIPSSATVTPFIPALNLYDASVPNFDLINDWHSFTQEEKNKKYSKFLCHEFNIYLYFKDHSYFESVVKPFIE